MKNNSKFAILPIFICLFLTITALALLFLMIKFPDSGMILPILCFVFVIYFWLTEFRTRAHKIEITNDKIIKREYFGLGKKISYNLKSLEGFYISSQPSNHGSYEYIFIIHEGKRIASLSKFYHRNYNEMKTIIDKKIKYLGTKDYRFKFEYKQMFK